MIAQDLYKVTSYVFVATEDEEVFFKLKRGDIFFKLKDDFYLDEICFCRVLCKLGIVIIHSRFIKERCDKI